MESDELKRLMLESVNEMMFSNRFNKNYVNEINRGIKQFYSWTSSRGFDDITVLGKKELLSYRNFVMHLESANPGGGKLSMSTMNSKLSAVKHIYSMLYIHGFISENPFHALDYKIKNGKKILRRPLSQREISVFLESIDTSTPQGLRDRTIFELIYSSGLRVNEACSLKIGDINFDSREAIVRGKFDRDRIVPISHVAIEFLKLYLAERLNNVDGHVFLGLRAKGFQKPMRRNNVSRIFREYLRRFGMDSHDISTHSIRHSTATHLLDNGASVRHVQELLGHKNIETTVRYTHVQTDGLYRIFRKHHPREHDIFEMVDEEYLSQVDHLIKNLVE